MAAATQDKKPAKAPDTGADAAAKRAERSAKKVPQRGTGRVLMLKRDQIVVRKEFNPRTSMEKEALAELAASIEQRGLLQAITVRPDTKGKDRYFLLGGHRRVAAGDQVGIKEYPAVIRESDERDELVDAFIDNRLREDLTPLEEATTFHRLKEGGLTVKGIADSCTVSEKLVHDRLAILELPPGIQKHYGDGTLPTGTVRPLVAMAKMAPALATKVVHDALDDRRHGISPAGIAQSPEQWAVAAAQHVKGLYVVDWQGRVDATALPWKDYKGGDTLTTADDVARMCKAMSENYYSYHPKLTRSELDTLRAAGVLYGATSRGDGDAVVNDAQSLMAVVEPIIRRDHAAYLKRQAEHRAATRKGGDAAKAADERAEEYKKQVEAREQNLALGDALLGSLKSVTLTMDVAKALCLGILEGDIYGTGSKVAVQMAMRGLRYVLPSWQEETQQKNGKVRVKYPSINGGGTKELEERFWEWWNLAATPGEVVGRTLIALAAATYANQDAVPQSQRSWHQVFGHSESKAKAALEAIVKPHLPKQAKKREKKSTSTAATAATPDAPAPIPGQTTVDEQVKAAAPKTRAAKDPRRDEALKLITSKPGITIPELAAAMGVTQNTLYRVLPALAEEKLIIKSGKGWHKYTSPGAEEAAPALQAQPDETPEPIEVTHLQAEVLKLLHGGFERGKHKTLNVAIAKQLKKPDKDVFAAIGELLSTIPPLLGGSALDPYITKRGSELAGA